MTLKPHTDDERLNDLYHSYAAGRISRRGFIRGASALTAAGLTIPAWMLGDPAYAAAAQAAAGSAQPVLDLAEWSYFFVGVERAELARATYVNGKQMYVEAFIPAQVRHPYPMVLVHGGGGQGLDWLGTPDGRRGWAQILLEEGYKVYVVDRPGHGRSPVSPRRATARSPAQANTLEGISGRFTPPNAAAPDNGPYRKLHTQWPGTGELGSKDLDQFVSSQGGSYVNLNAPAAAPGRTRAAAARGAAGAAAGRLRMQWPRRRAGRRGARIRRRPCSVRPAHRPADRIRSIWSGVSAARCCSTRSAPPSS